MSAAGMGDGGTKTLYEVSQGWVWFVRCGDRVEERKSDSPDSEGFGTLEEAKACFESWSGDLKRTYRIERQCAGRAWREQDAYVELSRNEYSLDEDGELEWCECSEVLDESRYGREDYERDHPDMF